MAETKSRKAENGFAALGLEGRLLTALAELGYEEPTEIQKEAIPHLLTGRDMVGQAATGTGKTAAFTLPLVQLLSQPAGKGSKGAAAAQGKPRALILAPTRELAIQVAEAVHRYGRALNIRVLPIYGGQSYEPQIRGLRRGVDVVVATPGRALDHLNRKTLVLDQLQAVVLDEADEMLDLGFLDDIETILKATPAERQIMLFSATMAPRIASIAKRYLNDPVRIQIVSQPLAAGESPKVKQTVFIVPRARKLEALSRLLDFETPKAALIFCRTRNEVDLLTDTLKGHGHQVEALHGGMTQVQRERVLRRLRAEEVDLVVATDVAARGLDIDQLTHVINFDVPSAPEAYVHRIGRVGRAGREGTALTLAEPREQRLMRNIERVTKQRIPIGKVPSFADMQAMRREQTRAAIQAVLIAEVNVEGQNDKDNQAKNDGKPKLDAFRGIVESLAEEFDVFQVAMAAVKLLHLNGERG